LPSFLFEEEFDLHSEQLKDYVESLVPMRDLAISEMERFAKDNDIPIMELVGIEALLQILRLTQPKRILEIGTAIGYSAIRMAKALPNAKIITIERDEKRYKKALYYIEKTGTKNQIDVIFGDALEKYLSLQVENDFDVLFIDAAKGQNKNFFENYQTLLTANGVIITDNVLFKGYVAEKEIDSRNLRGLVSKIKSYNEWLKQHPAYDTVFLPVGDGIAISKRKGGNN
jgi:predicted O-methyltransferase YrrM